MSSKKLFRWMLFILLVVPIVAYIYALIKKREYYEELAELKRDIVDENEDKLEFKEYEELPAFEERLASISDFLPGETFRQLRREALRHHKTERNYVPGHKKGGTISYEELHRTSPQIVAFYNSQYLRRQLSRIIGAEVAPTPINDQSSCALLFYDRPGDHIGWHYDYNFYNGRHFTVLLPIINKHLERDGYSSSQLIVQKNGREMVVPTPPNALIVFEGQEVYHKATRLGEDELRVLLSMTFCTDPSTTWYKTMARRIKDVGFFGIRALWT